MEIRIESLVEGAQRAEGLTVIIDVFRCFTTEAVAFENGAEKIILVAEIEEAFNLRKQGVGDLLMGEVGGKLAGFLLVVEAANVQRARNQSVSDPD